MLLSIPLYVYFLINCKRSKYVFKAYLLQSLVTRLIEIPRSLRKETLQPFLPLRTDIVRSSTTGNIRFFSYRSHFCMVFIHNLRLLSLTLTNQNSEGHERCITYNAWNIINIVVTLLQYSNN